MSIIAIDFETATSARDSACEIGFATIDGGRVSSSGSLLIKPPCWPNFEHYNVRLHGISPKKVASEPTFDQLWPHISDLIGNRTVVAHNASFDIGVLRDMLKAYNLPLPSNPYFCTYRLARKVWPELGKFGLKTMAQHLSLDFGRHHRAEDDSRGCAEVLLHAMEAIGTDDIPLLMKKMGLPLLTIPQFGHDLTVTGRREIPKGDPSRYRPGHVLFGKNIVFSGTLESMSRAQAWQRVADIGATIEERISPETNILVVGQIEIRHNETHTKSSKQRHAERLISKGTLIQIWTEHDFLANID